MSEIKYPGLAQDATFKASKQTHAQVCEVMSTPQMATLRPTEVKRSAQGYKAGSSTRKVKPLSVHAETDGTSTMPRWSLPLSGFSAADVAQVIFLEILWKQPSDYTTCDT